jgi:deazaflavin-dependent oxidoreductase (nitroreductase family)
MWFMQSIVNPWMAMLLRSPLHALVSGNVLLIEVTGKKSGRHYALPVNYARAGDVVYILPGNPEQKTWWRNLRGGAVVRVWLGGKAQPGTAEILSGEKDHRAVAEGLAVYFQRFPAAAGMRQVRRSPNGAFDSIDLHEAALHTVLVRVMLGER